MSEYKPGTMDIRAQQETFSGFIRFITRVIIITIVALIFLALVGA